MSIEFIVFIATSLDGFIAREDGGIDWLPGHDASESEAEGAHGSQKESDTTGDPEDTTSESENAAGDIGFFSFINRIDALLMGRGTYDILKRFDVPWPYEGRPAYVLSRTMTPADIKPEHKELVRLIQGEPEKVIQRLQADGMQRIYVDGGQVIQQYLRAGLIGEMILTTIPVLIGQGIPLFGRLVADIQLKLQKLETYSGGIVQSYYRVLTDHTA